MPVSCITQLSTLRKVIDTIFVPISPTIIQHLFSLRNDSSMATHAGQTYLPVAHLEKIFFSFSFFPFLRKHLRNINIIIKTYKEKENRAQCTEKFTVLNVS